LFEIMRDAAGELSERLQPLAVLERFLGLPPPGSLGVKVAAFRRRASDRIKKQQRRGGGHAENQIAGPMVASQRGADRRGSRGPALT